MGKKNNSTFTEKQKDFIRSWNGDVASTAEIVGISHVYGQRLVKRDDISQAIRETSKARIVANNRHARRTYSVASSLEVLRFWTAIMKGDVEAVNGMVKKGKDNVEKITVTERLKASQFLGDYLGITQKVAQTQVNITAEDVVFQLMNGTYKEPQSVSERRIEATTE